MQKFVPRSRMGIFSQRTHPIHPIGLQTHDLVCFVLFGCIWNRLAALQNIVQNGPNLVQKFVPQSRVIIFHNEHTRLTPLGPKLMFWCISYYLGAFGTVWLPYKTWCKTSRSGVKVRATKSCRNFSQWTTWSTLLDPNLMFRCVCTFWVHLG